MSAESIANGIEEGVSSFFHNPGVQHLGVLAVEGLLVVGLVAAGAIYIRNRFRDALNR